MRALIILVNAMCVAACSAATDVADIQGAGVESPFVGQPVTVAGVVTGDFQDNDNDVSRNLGGFYLQSDDPDDDPATSDGIFVYDGRAPETDVSPGDRVEVRGIVKEHFGETQVSATSVVVVGAGVIEPTDVRLPADLEAYEGMLLRFPGPLTVSGLRSLERFGEMTLSEGGRLYQFTNGNPPDVAGFAAHQQSIAGRSIVLDDGRRDRYPDTLRYITPGTVLRAGDAIEGLTGNLRYSRGSGAEGSATWRLMPTAPTLFESRNPRPDAPDVGGSVRVAGVNVLNFFLNVTTGRGADNEEELARQLGKTATALVMMNADIIGLTELENDANGSLSALVTAINARLDTPVYGFVDTGKIHTDGIKTGFIYNASTVTPTGAFALLDSSIDPRFNDARNRPALAQSFTVNATGAIFTVVVNHLKSKSSSCAEDGDPNLNDGQGNCNRTRSNAAAALADWVRTDPTGSGDPDYLVIGDLNAYMQEDPLRALTDGGLVNLLAGLEDPYSFSYDNQAGALDHALATPSLAPQVVAALEWHINADEPPILDYNLENGRDPALFDGNSPYRSSDHDPVIIGLDPAD